MARPLGSGLAVLRTTAGRWGVPIQRKTERSWVPSDAAHRMRDTAEAPNECAETSNGLWEAPEPQRGAFGDLGMAFYNIGKSLASTAAGLSNIVQSSINTAETLIGMGKPSHNTTEALCGFGKPLIRFGERLNYIGKRLARIGEGSSGLGRHCTILVGGCTISASGKPNHGREQPIPHRRSPNYARPHLAWFRL